MKNLIVKLGLFLSIISLSLANYTMELKGGLSLSDKYVIGSENFNGRLTYNLAAELMYETSPETEVGIGISFKANSSTKGTFYGENSNSSMHLFDSVPVYGIAKYILPEVGMFTPYVKAYLGISFNQIGSYDYAESISPGLHTGLGVGGTYENVVADLSYVITQGELEFWHNKSGTFVKEKRDVKLTSITLTIGYKFEVNFLN